MWQTLLSLSFAYSTVFFKFIVAESLQHGQITGTLKFSPAVRATLPNYQRALNYPTGNLGEKTFEVPITSNKFGKQFEGQYASSDNCPQLESLKNILAFLKRFLNQDEDNYFLQPEKSIPILQFLKEYLEKSESQNSGVENSLKLKELIARTDKTVLDDNNAEPQNLDDVDKNDHVEANVMFKYEIPVINNVDCKEALAALIKTVNGAYLRMINYCNQLGKCKFNSEQDLFNFQHSNKPNTVLALDSTGPSQTKITLSNPSLSNINHIEGSDNNVIKTNNQEVSQTSVSDYYNTRSMSDLISNKYLTSTSLNSDIVQSQNDQEKNENINLNKEASQSNIQYGDKSNVLKLNNFLSFYNPVSSQVQVTSDNQNLWNAYDVQNPLKNLIAIPQNQGDSSQRLSSQYLNHPAQQQLQLDTKNLIFNSAWNRGTIQTNSKQNENFDITNNEYLNMLNNNDLENFINTHKIVNNGYNAVPTLKVLNVKGFALPNYSNSYPNQEVYKGSRVVPDNKASLAKLNQNNHNTKEHIQFVGEPIPGYEFNNINYPSNINPYQGKGLVNPTFFTPVNLKQIPYLSSVNLNHQNGLNYNSQKKSDAIVQSNFGINIDAPTIRDYPKHNIYGNTLFDSNRHTSTSNWDKLNSVSDNNEVVELTYKLKRPESMSYNPYYYVTFRMPYRDYVSKIIDISKNLYMRSDPLKLQEEQLAISNFAEASSDVKNQNEVSKIVSYNGGTLSNVEVVPSTSDSNASDFLKTIQKLNGNLDTNEILNVVENNRTSKQATALDLGVSGFTKQNSGGLSSYHAVNQQYIDDRIPRRNSPLPNGTATPISFTFLPSKVTSQLLWNAKPVTVLANLT